MPLVEDRRIVRDGKLAIQERDAANSLLREYTWGLNLGGGIGGLLAMRQSGQEYHYLYDGKGNVSAVIDSTQTIVASYCYDSFGRLTTQSGTLDQPYRFSTKQYLADVGLNYYGYRFYSPAMGRWLNRDPLGETGGLNLYAFVQNNPSFWVDPYGLDLSDIPGGIITAISGGFNGISEVGSGIAGQYEQGRQNHYDRNQYNQSVTYNEARESWDGNVPARYHRQGQGNEGNQKFVSPDGHSEAVFTDNGVPVTDPVNMPTYNFADPRSNYFGHFVFDMLPYYVWGNTPDDPSQWYNRIVGNYDGVVPCD